MMIAKKLIAFFFVLAIVTQASPATLSEIKSEAAEIANSTNAELDKLETFFNQYREFIAAEQKANTAFHKRMIKASLDKINEVGYENLSDKEKKLLQEASRFLSQE